MARNRRNDRAAEAFVEKFATAMVDSGMPRMAARVFAHLLAQDSGAATAAQLAEALEASPAAISGAVRYLAQVRLITREKNKGERFDTYRLYSEVWYEAIYNREHELTRWIELSKLGMRAVGEHTPAYDRLADTADFFDFLREEMDGVLERWRAQRV